MTQYCRQEQNVFSILICCGTTAHSVTFLCDILCGVFFYIVVMLFDIVQLLYIKPHSSLSVYSDNMMYIVLLIET